MIGTSLDFQGVWSHSHVAVVLTLVTHFGIGIVNFTSST
jgi:hypothetical protein